MSPNLKTYYRLLGYVKPYTGFLVLSVIFSVIFSLVNVLVIPTIGNLSEAIGNKDRFQLTFAALLIVGLYILRGATAFAKRYFAAHADLGITKDLRIKIFEHLQDLSLDYYARTRTGEIIMIVMNNINMMQNAIMASFTSIIPGVLTILGIAGYLLTLNWKLALLSFVMMPFLTILSVKFGSGMKSIAGKTQEKVAYMTSMLHEVVTGAKIVKSFTMEREEIKRFDAAVERMKDLQMKMSLFRAAQSPLFNVVQAMAAVVVIWFGGNEIISGGISPGNLIAFFTGVIMLGEPITELSGINITIQTALVAAKRYFGLLDITPSVKDTPGAMEPSTIVGSVTLNNVSFKYLPDAAFVLNNININCPAGSVVAIVGHSGAGKSTLIGLIPRFYDASDGDVLIDGINIRDYRVISLRKHIAIVPQETLLFSGTIRQNIAYGRMNATDKEIVNAAKMANAHDFIMAFPDKYETVIGEKGIRLSGGERQRVSIARAFLRDPKILILDEATSSLDSESERAVQQALEKLMTGRTTFVIAHRLSTVRFADRIIVISKGRIVEQGSHDELIALEGSYKKLYDIQLGKPDIERPKVFGSIKLRDRPLKRARGNALHGWVISDGDIEIARVKLVCDGKTLGEAPVNVATPEVRVEHPNFKHSHSCGFVMDFQAEDGEDRIYRLQIFGPDGRKISRMVFRMEEFSQKEAIQVE